MHTILQEARLIGVACWERRLALESRQSSCVFYTSKWKKTKQRVSWCVCDQITPLPQSLTRTSTQSDISPGLDVKQPKVVAGCVTVVKEIVRCVTVLRSDEIERLRFGLMQRLRPQDNFRQTYPGAFTKNLRPCRQECTR